MDIPANYLERIRALRPDLTTESAASGHPDGDSSDNDVIIVGHPDGKWVFRFARTDDRRQRMVFETRVLDLLRERAAMPVPHPVVREADVMAYHWIEGEPLTPWLIASLDEAAQQRLADQLGAFLRALHSTPSDEPLPDSSPDEYRAYFAERLPRVRETLYPRVMAFQREWVERLFSDALRDLAFFEYQPRLIHNDFKVCHILYDAGPQRLSGVLDFSYACYADPAIDIGNLMQWYGETFVSRMFTTYPEMCALMPRARFIALLCEVDWLMQGMEPNGEHWFFANLATNRDIRFPILP